MTIKVATVNFYVHNDEPIDDLRQIEHLFQFDVIGMQETHRKLELIKGRLKDSYHLFHSLKTPGTRGSRENLVGIRRKEGYEILDWDAYRVSEPARPFKIAPERFLVWVKFKDDKGRKFKIINLHPNAAVQSRTDGRLLSTKIERVFGWVQAMRALNKEIRKGKEQGFIILVTGDMNYREYRSRDFVLNYWSPQRIFRRAGMGYRNRSVDYVGWLPRQGSRYKREGVVGQRVTGSDHDWLWVELG